MVFTDLLHFLRDHYRAIVALGIFLSVSLAVATIPSETLIDTVGSNNAFVVMFLLGLIGGLTTFTGVPYQIMLMSFAAGGLSPLLLGVSTAAGVMLGDSTMYLIGRGLKSSLSPRLRHTLERIAEYLSRHPRLVTPSLIVYGSISPFSNDFVVGSLSIMGYSFWRTILPLAIGNIIYNVALAYFGVYLYNDLIG